MKKVKEVCRIALIEEFIDLNNKYDLNKSLGESGIKLSGGQRQGSSKSLYKNSDVLILDEATSALDLVTENNHEKSSKLLQRFNYINDFT